MKAYRLARDEEIRKDFEGLFEHKRLRLDDVLERISRRYGLAHSTILRVLRRQGIYKERDFKKIPLPVK